MAMNEILCRPLPFTVIGHFNTAVPGSQVNVGNDRLGRAWRVYGSDLGNITLDLGAAISVDTFAMLATNGTFGSHTVRIIASNTADFAALLYDSGFTIGLASVEAARRLHRQSFKSINPPVVARYWRVHVANTPLVGLDVGRIILGKAFLAADTMDIGYSFKVVDLGETGRANNGLDDPTIRGKVLEYRWTWSWMSELEARGALLDLQAYAGVTRNVLCVLNPDAVDLHNVIGYGPFQETIENKNVAGGSVDNAYEASFALQSRLILNL